MSIQPARERHDGDQRRSSVRLRSADDGGRCRSAAPGRQDPAVRSAQCERGIAVGDYMVAVALPWFVLQTTGSVVQMGFAGAVVGIGTLVSSISGGPLVDRFGLRRASILSDVTAGAAVAAVPLLFWADALPFWLILTLAFVISILNAPGDLARRAMVPALARWAAMPLERANAADTAIPRLAQLAGPLTGGVLVAVGAAANVLLLDAATFLLSAVFVALAVPSRTDAENKPSTPGFG